MGACQASLADLGDDFGSASVRESSKEEEDTGPNTPPNSPVVRPIATPISVAPLSIDPIAESEEKDEKSEKEEKREKEKELHITVDTVSHSARLTHSWSPFRFKILMDRHFLPTAQEEVRFEQTLAEAQLPTVEAESPTTPPFLHPPSSPLPLVGLTIHNVSHFLLRARRVRTSGRLDRQMTCEMIISCHIIPELLLLYVNILNQTKHLVRDLGCAQIELTGHICDVQHALDGKAMLEHLLQVALTICTVASQNQGLSPLHDVGIQLETSAYATPSSSIMKKSYWDEQGKKTVVVICNATRDEIVEYFSREYIK